MRDTQGTLRIGEVARCADVNIQTLRYYERRGILDPPERSPSGYRQYPVETVDLVRTIKRAQKLGFSLAEIEQLLKVREGAYACTRAQGIASRKLDLLNAKIRELLDMKQTLQELIRDCQPDGHAQDCGLLVALGEGEAFTA